MIAISLWQPWATLVAVGAKRVETRHWRPPMRVLGRRVAVHAAKRTDDLNACLTEPFRSALADAGALTDDAYRAAATGEPTKRAIAAALAPCIPLGYVVATCVIARATQISAESAERLEHARPAEHAFGDYTPGRFAWVLEDVRQLDPPVKARGGQGFFDVDLSDLQREGRI